LKKGNVENLPQNVTLTSDKDKRWELINTLENDTNAVVILKDDLARRRDNENIPTDFWHDNTIKKRGR